jgi:hypothetical protein
VAAIEVARTGHPWLHQHRVTTGITTLLNREGSTVERPDNSVDN